MQKQAEQTFEQILEDNKGSIYRICRINAVSPVEPQDLFQEVVYHIWKSYPSFKGKSSINTWIYRIALNVCLRSKLKEEKNRGQIIQLDSIQILPAESDYNKGEEEKYRVLHSCISSLNEIDKSIIILNLEELPYKEIAVITGLSENHIAVKMQRIRKILLDCITPKLK